MSRINRSSIVFDRVNVSVYVAFLTVLSFDAILPDFVKEHDCSVTGGMDRDVPKWLFFAVSSSVFVALNCFGHKIKQAHSDWASDIGEIVDTSLFISSVTQSSTNVVPNTCFYVASAFATTPLLMRGVAAFYPALVRGTRHHFNEALSGARHPHLTSLTLSFFEAGLHCLGAYSASSLVLSEMTDIFWSTTNNQPYPYTAHAQIGLLLGSLILAALAVEFTAPLTLLRGLKGSVSVLFAYSMVPLSVVACVSDWMSAKAFPTIGEPVSIVVLLVSSLMALQAGYAHARFPWSEEDNRQELKKSVADIACSLWSKVPDCRKRNSEESTTEALLKRGGTNSNKDPLTIKDMVKV